MGSINLMDEINSVKTELQKIYGKRTENKQDQQPLKIIKMYDFNEKLTSDGQFQIQVINQIDPETKYLVEYVAHKYKR